MLVKIATDQSCHGASYSETVQQKKLTVSQIFKLNVTVDTFFVPCQKAINFLLLHFLAPNNNFTF